MRIEFPKALRILGFVKAATPVTEAPCARLKKPIAGSIEAVDDQKENRPDEEETQHEQ